MRWILGAAFGAVGGFVWYRLSGGSCSPEACPITSNPVVTVVYGAVLGAALAGGR
jgi:hypothetical protein